MDSTVPSMPRSSVGSAPDDAMLGRYPVDDITENTNCELHFKMKNISMKVSDAVAFSNSPEATFHCNRFRRAMLVSSFMRWWPLIRSYSLTFLEVTTSTHWERPYIVSSYGERIASSFEGHRHRVS